MRLRLKQLDRDFDPNKVVTDSSPVVDKTGKFSDGGIFSERIFGRMPSSDSEYSCDCGQTSGRYNEGVTCMNVFCQTVVTCRDSVYDKQGWIDLGGHAIINPRLFADISKIVGPSQLLRIIQQKRVLTVDGVAPDTEGSTPASAGPFDNMGMIEFTSRWLEVVEFYEAKRARQDPRITDHANLLREHASKVVVSRLPIFSQILRPALLVDKQMIFDEINNLFNLLISNANILAEMTEDEATELNINSTLLRIQERANEIMQHVIQTLSGKGGYLRGDLLGVRINFSGRNVITPLPMGYKQDEVVIPYLTMLELYRFQITNLLTRMYRVSMMKADEMWNAAQTTFCPRIHAVMLELIRRGNCNGRGLPAFINRNPTIAFGSIIRVRIVGVKVDLTDYTMSLHNGILRLMGGDYDGDVLTLVPLLDWKLDLMFKVFDPRLMSVSRDGPYLNRAMTPDKDHVLGLSVLTEDPQ